jgi:transcriptional antiterminator RfaH
MPFWAVVRVQPHHDRLAAECVAMAGFETFVPKIRVKVESRWRTTPLFPGYFFTRVIDRWRALERTMGVLTVVKFGAAPARVPDAEISSLIARADPDGIIRLPGRPPLARRPPATITRGFAAGQPVKIVDGALRGFDAIYSGMSAQEREVILIDLLGSQRPVEIAAGLLAPQ